MSGDNAKTDADEKVWSAISALQWFAELLAATEPFTAEIATARLRGLGWDVRRIDDKERGSNA